MTQSLPRSIKDNLRFLVSEVDGQLSHLQAFFLQPSKLNARRVIDRSGYSYNLKARIHTSCVSQLARSKNRNSETTQLLRTIELIATGLERITELCSDCVKQVESLSQIKCLQASAYPPMLEHVKKSITLILPAIEQHDSQRAQKIGRSHSRLRNEYERLYKDYISTLKSRRKNTHDLAHALFVAHSVEQMGDTLMAISEAILSANIGQTVNLQQYRALHNSMEDLRLDRDLSDMQIETIAHTRSGSAISGVSANRKNNDYLAIYKDGLKSKLKEERQGVESWHEIYPGLAPKVLSYKKRGQTASLLIEHLPGQTFEQILLNEPDLRLQEALNQLMKTLRSVWRETRSNKPSNAGYMTQLQKRLTDVYKIHPEFRYGDQQLCGLKVPSFDHLVQQAGGLEARLKAPFSVYIHGDFNLDNIIYDPLEKRINFIDLHRSCYMDYVQDVSVFMVSNYRLQILDAPLRRRIMSLAIDFYQRSRRFAIKQKDDTFELRLALGLARSFATSTRFILDKSLARSMFLRSRYLLTCALDCKPGKASKFRLPIREIFVA